MPRIEKRIRPLHDRIVVKPEAVVTQIGAVILPDEAQERPAEGTVVRVGTGKILPDGQKVAIDVKVGDVVYYGKFSGQDITIDGNDYKLLREDEVLGVLEIAEIPDEEDPEPPPLDMPVAPTS